jgi:hypothetical protein
MVWRGDPPGVEEHGRAAAGSSGKLGEPPVSSETKTGWDQPGIPRSKLGGGLPAFDDLNWMHEAYRRVRKDAAPGVDGQTVGGYGENLSTNLKDLLSRAKDGSYKAPPVKRAYVPKNEKEDRPIGLPTVEDKILQRAVAMILEPIYEEEFFDFSFGFRPGRSPHR